MEGLLAVVDVSGIEFDLVLIVDIDVELDGNSFEGAFGRFELVTVDALEFVSDAMENGEFELLG
jgi:hypothetical protein